MSPVRVVRNWKRACAGCHGLNQPYWVLQASERESPLCRRCFSRALWRPPRDRQGRYGRDVRPLSGRIRALGHDRAMASNVRIFALAYLEDTGEGDDADLSLLSLLEAGYSESEIVATLGPRLGPPSGAHGVPLGGAEPLAGPSDTAGKSEAPRKAAGEPAPEELP